MTIRKPIRLADVVKAKKGKPGREISAEDIKWTIHRGIFTPTPTFRGSEKRLMKVAEFKEGQLQVVYYSRPHEFFVISAHYKRRPAKRRRLEG